MIRLIYILLMGLYGGVCIGASYKMTVSNHLSSLSFQSNRGHERIIGSGSLFKGTLYPTLSFGVDDLAFGVGSWVNKDTDNDLFNDLMAPAGILLKRSIGGVRTRLYASDKLSLLKVTLSDNLSIFHSYESLSVSELHTVSLGFDVSNPAASVPFIAKGSIHYSHVTDDQTGTGGYVTLGTPIKVMGTTVHASATKINWHWNNESLFDVREHVDFYVPFSREYANIRRGVSVDTWLFKYGISQSFKVVQWGLDVQTFSDQGSHSLVRLMANSSFGVPNMRFNIGLIKSSRHDMKVIVGMSLLDSMSL